MAFGLYFAGKKNPQGFTNTLWWIHAWPYLITYCWWHGHHGTFRAVPNSSLEVEIFRCIHCQKVVCFFPRGMGSFPPGTAIVLDDSNAFFSSAFQQLHGVTIKQALGEKD
jgi:hypothetical protein